MWVRGDEAIGTPPYTFHLQVSLLDSFLTPKNVLPYPITVFQTQLLFSGLNT